MLVKHYSVIQKWPWKDFHPEEMACKCCGELFIDFDGLNRLQNARNQVKKPFNINSAHRCALHNARIGGAALSQHKKLAFDISTENHDRLSLFDALVTSGFTTFGLYENFIHTDSRSNRRWFGSDSARKVWQFVVTSR